LLVSHILTVYRCFETQLLQYKSQDWRIALCNSNTPVQISLEESYILCLVRNVLFIVCYPNRSQYNVSLIDTLRASKPAATSIISTYFKCHFIIYITLHMRLRWLDVRLKFKFRTEINRPQRVNITSTFNHMHLTLHQNYR
jgi:hypothetical protein